VPTKAKDAPPAPQPEEPGSAPAPSKAAVKPKAEVVKPKPAGPRSRPSEPNLGVVVKPDEPKRRPSEPNLAVLPRPEEPGAKTKRASEPNLAVAKPDARSRPSELAIAVDPRLKPEVKRPAEPAKPKKPEPKKPPPKGELPAEWRALVGKPLSCSWRRTSGHMIDVIDWAQFPDRTRWLEQVFAGSDPSKHFTGLLARKAEHLEWTSPVMLPVALLGQQHGGEGSLEAILLIDTTTADSPIFAIEVDGTAVPAKKPQQVAANLAALKIESVKPGPKAKVDFDTARPKIVSKKIDGEARKILQKLSGDRDAGSGYLQDHLKTPHPPEGRDPRWIEALRDELAKSIVAASESLQAETHMLAGTLASFGEPAVPALVAAFEAALKSYPKHSLDYGVQPVLLALDHLKSDAGVAPALVILAKAKAPEKSYAVPPVLEYLKTRTADPRIAPVLKKFYKKAAPKKPMHYIGDLEAIVKQLDI
jgi:hypothetical protein